MRWVCFYYEYVIGFSLEQLVKSEMVHGKFDITLAICSDDLGVNNKLRVKKRTAHNRDQHIYYKCTTKNKQDDTNWISQNKTKTTTTTRDFRNGRTLIRAETTMC